MENLPHEQRAPHIPEAWKPWLTLSLIDLGESLYETANREREQGKTIFPPAEDTFRALELVRPEDVKVVILGQDPYHEQGQGNGLAFSVNDGVKFPPSLRNIFKELCADIGCYMPTSGDLTPWAKQGVLLLNTVLTVEEGKANSHKDWGWQVFVDGILKACMELPQPVVFLLWGAPARKLMEPYMGKRNSVNKKFLCSSHPSPLGATKASKGIPAFLGSKPFSAANQWLVDHDVGAIDWTLYWRRD